MYSIATVIYLATRRIVGYDEERPSVQGQWISLFSRMTLD